MRAKKSLGQNFLRDETVVSKIVDSLDLNTNDVVIEIGPGQGALTETLLVKARRVVAVEFDRDMISILKVKFHFTDNLFLIERDALNVDFAQIVGDVTEGEKIKLVANLPYNISTPILQRLIEQRSIFSTIILMFQREVVERIIALAGGKERGYLSVLVENAFTTERLFDVAPAAFTPVPKVWSSVVRLTPHADVAIDGPIFRSLLSASFAQKRKTLFNNLKILTPAATELLIDAGIDGRRRAETITLDEWSRLVTKLSNYKETGRSK